MRRLAGPHLTEQMRDAALAYAARLRKANPDLSTEDALAEAQRLAAQNLLTVDGFLKPRKRKKAAKK